MKFLKKHKWFSVAVISFLVLSGINFYMISKFIIILIENGANLRHVRNLHILKNFPKYVII